uniref:UPAR/Ly6 domain-containing protein n=1 Tax=Steinernema glaseri TaxID=37863 RepID=A0A1I8ADM4_9BILA
MLLFWLQLLISSPLVFAGLGGNSCRRAIDLGEAGIEFLRGLGYHFSYANEIEDCDDSLFTRHPCITVTLSDSSIIAGCANKNAYLQSLQDQGYCNKIPLEQSLDISWNVVCCKSAVGRNCNDNEDAYVPPQNTCPSMVYLDGEFTHQLTNAGFDVENSTLTTETCLWSRTSCVSLTAENNVIAGCNKSSTMRQFDAEFNYYHSCNTVVEISDMSFNYTCDSVVTNHASVKVTCNREVSLSNATLQSLSSSGLYLSNSPLTQANCTGIDERCIELFIGNDTIKGCSSDPVLELVSTSCSDQEPNSCDNRYEGLTDQDVTLCCCDNDLCNNWRLTSCYREVSLSVKLMVNLSDVNYVHPLMEISRRKEACGMPDDKCVTLTDNAGSLIEGCVRDLPLIDIVSSQCPEGNETISVEVKHGYFFNMTCCSTDNCNVLGGSNDKDGHKAASFHSAFTAFVFIVTYLTLV